MTRTRARWVIAFLIGLATVTAAAFSWRAAQIGSTAAFDDRQSISETVRVEQDAVERSIEVAAQAREYARYRADYAVAAALDRQADRLAAGGSPGLARVPRAEAASLRTGATRRAAVAGVFGSFTISNDLLKPSARPRPFDVKARADALAAEQSTALDAPGKLNPGHWAAEATSIRVRVNGLIRWAFGAVIAVLLYTLAEVSERRRTMYGFAGAGLLVYLAVLIAAVSTVFF